MCFCVMNIFSRNGNFCISQFVFIETLFLSMISVETNENILTFSTIKINILVLFLRFRRFIRNYCGRKKKLISVRCFCKLIISKNKNKKRARWLYFNGFATSEYQEIILNGDENKKKKMSRKVYSNIRLRNRNVNKTIRLLEYASQNPMFGLWGLFKSSASNCMIKT